MSDRQDDALNPYAPPSQRASDGQSPTEGFEDIPEAGLLADFVGPNSQRYLVKWRPVLRGEGRAGFNWAAFLFGVFWLAYRRMYGVAAILIAVSVVSALAELAFAAWLPEAFASLLARAEPWIAAGVCGVFGNGWYLARARRIIAENQQQGLQGAALRLALSRQGGTSVVAVFVVLAIQLLLVAGVLLLAAEFDLTFTD